MTTTEILEDSESALDPKMAIIVYQQGYSDFYLERRDIKDGKMCAGKPLTKKCLGDIAESLTSDQSDIVHGRISENMLYADCRKGVEKYVWWNAPEQRQMYFSKSLAIPNGKMQIPGLVYMVNGCKLSVFAFKGRRPKNKLCGAPFFNVYADGGVCLGNARVRQPDTLTYEGIIQYWEDMFWKSEFAAILHNPISNNLAVLTKQLIESGGKFPEGELVEVKTRLKNLV